VCGRRTAIATEPAIQFGPGALDRGRTATRGLAVQIIRNRTLYDVCVVGSGAGGGMAAKVLTEAGASVIMLEAGPMWDAVTDTKMFAWPYDSPRRGAATPERHFGEFDGALGGWTLEGEPYTTGEGSTFDWFRSRMLGGRTNHWGRISLRYGPDDFRRKSLDGLGDDWPITYDDLKPYYDQIDTLIGIFGTNEGLHNDPDGVFMSPPQPRCYELLIKQAADRLKITCIPSRLSIITQPLNGRPKCHYCGQCGRGCATHSNFSSPSVLIPPALATKRLTILPNAMAREVTVDEAGLATGVAYIDKATRRENHVRARIVVLAASACESARILLNSKSAKFPHGLGNSTGNVGKYLTDSTGLSVTGLIPKLMDGVPHNEDGVGGMHIYMPWWLDNRKLDFPRGYHIEPGGGRRMPSFGFMGGIHNYIGLQNSGRPPSAPGYGKPLKDDYRRFYGATVNFAGRGEMVPNKDSYCELDPAVVDQWGIPVLRFHFKWSDHEINQAKHMQETFRAIIAEMGGVPLTEMPSREDGYGIAPGGRIIHEVGVTRMGNDPNTSVLNSRCQAHDCRNVFVADGGPLVSNPDKNCTWSILALAMRTSEYIAEQRKIGAI
jgi:choline dehydrogenase-like flavoprotein